MAYKKVGTILKVKCTNGGVSLFVTQINLGNVVVDFVNESSAKIANASLSFTAFRGEKATLPSTLPDNAKAFQAADGFGVPVYIGPGDFYTTFQPQGYYYGEAVIYCQTLGMPVKYVIALCSTPTLLSTPIEELPWKPGTYEQPLNLALGPSAGANFQQGTKATVAAGYNALNAAGANCDATVALGSKALAVCKAPTNSEAIGNGAMSATTYTDRNTCVGDGAGKWAGCANPDQTNCDYFHVEDDPDTGQNSFYRWEMRYPAARDDLVGPKEGPPKPGHVPLPNQTVPAVYREYNQNNVYLGRDAGNHNVLGKYNVIVGSHAAHGWNMDRCTFIGANCGTFALSAADCVGIGQGYLNSNVTGTFNTAGGVHAMYENVFGTSNTAWGAYALQSLTGYGNGIDNTDPEGAADQAVNNAAVGNMALAALTYGIANTAHGAAAFLNLEHGDNNTAIGHSAGRNDILGGPVTSRTNVTCVGYNSGSDGDDQVNLGNSNTSTYVYGSVQNRSDLRDKTDVRNTSLGLPFIEAVRPVEFRYDYRDAYVEEDGTVLPKDGSRAGTRFHQGVIAQELKETMDKLGVDFGGYQDHKVNGGGDVLTMGYDEFIAPLIKAVQELSARVKSLESAQGGVAPT